MSAFSAVTHVHLSKTYVLGYIRFLSTLTLAVNAPFGYIPQINVCSVGEIYTRTALTAIHLLSNWAHKVVLNSFPSSYYLCHDCSSEFTISVTEKDNTMSVGQQIFLNMSSSSLADYMLL